MSLISLILIALGLSMDAFAVSICKGLSVRRLSPHHMLLCGLYFGGFQGGMPLFGWLLGSYFHTAIVHFDHWISFALLALIGFQMIRERKEEAHTTPSFSPQAMVPLAVATSIDALAVGITFACLQVDILPACALIALITALLSALGVWLGFRFGARHRSVAQLAGGLILMAMGVKILLEHL